MKKIIVYYPFKIREQKSASAVRPTKMLEAFHEFGSQKGIEIIEIIGTSTERKKLVNDLYKNNDPKEIICCYMESQTIPIWLTDPDHIPRNPFLDVEFFKYLKKNHIPLGIFYRDIYWKFEKLLKVKSMVRNVMRQLFKLELKMYKKYATKFFLPSLMMNYYVKADPEKVVPLPPGGVFRQEYISNSNAHIVTGVYVGGISPRYGIYEVLEAFKQININQLKMKLLLVCRKEELEQYKDLMKAYLDEPWLELIHAFGDQLIPIYERGNFGIVPIKENTYNDFAVAVKLFEYMTYSLPILATNCEAQKAIVEEDDLGIIVEDNASSIEAGLLNMLDETKRNTYKDNVQSAIRKKHQWIHRAEKVVEVLTGNNF